MPETFPADRKAQPATGLQTAQYWTDWNAKRWADAVLMEQTEGHAVCDTDPLKLHYSWCLMQIGKCPKSQWELQLQTMRQAIKDERLGFADAYLVKIIDPMVARHQRDNDNFRMREGFDLHVQLQPPLIHWYKKLEATLGVRVRWELLESSPEYEAITPNRFRYDVGKFDAFIASLDNKT